MFDSHAHYDDFKFIQDKDNIIYTAHASGVNYILNASVDVESSQKSIEFANKYDFMYASVGIHPHECVKAKQEDIEKIHQLAVENEKVVAIGEIGLDFYYDYSPREQQISWFIKQIGLAKKLNLPIIVHNREAHQKTLEVIQQCNVSECGGVFHCFSGSVEMLKTIIDNNMSISVGGPITFKNARNLMAVVKYVPFDKLLVETDCPYLTPEPFRGKRNDSSFLRFIIEKIAEIKAVDFETVVEITTRNARRLFRIDLP